MEKINRRKFLKASALTGGALIAGNLLKGKTRTAYGDVKDCNTGKDQITIPATRIPVSAEADVVVLGAGPGGMSAAIRAAQSGADTLLIEKFGSPGGAMTNGFMSATKADKGGLQTEFNKRMRKEGLLFDALAKYPGVPVASSRFNFYPDAAAYVWMQMMEETNVKFLYCTLFVDVIIKQNRHREDTIEAVIVENASGRQAIRGKVFVDATGCADVVARAGAPFLSAGPTLAYLTQTGDIEGLPTPGALRYRISGVNYQTYWQYLKSDPDFAQKIAEATAHGDIPEGLFIPYPPGVQASRYKGHASPVISAPRSGYGDFDSNFEIPYAWGLHIDESGADLNLAQVELRKKIWAEFKFLKNYVPGFENSWIQTIAPMLIPRERRHPVGEYMITYEDLANNRKFPDAAIRELADDPLDFASTPPRKLEFDIPYRSFLPKKVNNLLLAGECISFTHECNIQAMRNMDWSILMGEVAGVAAGLSVEHGIAPKALNWTTGPLYYLVK